MKDICRKIGISLIVIGIISSFIWARVAGKPAIYDYERRWILTITYLVVGLFSTLILSTIFFVLSEILEKLENLEYLAIENNKSIKTLSKTNASPDLNEWKCKKCSKINPKYTGTCSCGESRP